ncbi:MAG: hypothetical protein A2Y25_05000 [Candidatus Melainabacteria bacterium GWF2_37_15]|nr:MAG: hypothetical protein A2Y25_05000 [Candidatus Melainabacteria bacterium GWF2_37_15]
MKVNPYENIGFRGLNPAYSGKTSQLSRSTPIRDQVTFSARGNESAQNSNIPLGGKLAQSIGKALHKLSELPHNISTKFSGSGSSKPAADGDLTGRTHKEISYTF